MTRYRAKKVKKHKIKYLGKGTSKSSGKTYNRYEVVVQDSLPVVDAAKLEPPWEDE